MKRRLFIFVTLFVALGLNAQEASKTNRWPSFLAQKDLPDATKFIPAPPDTSSIAYLNDFNRYHWGRSMRNTARGKQAVCDASVDIDSVLQGFSAAFGMPITKASMPELHYLMHRVENDASLSVRGAKKKYMRKRPYVQFGEATSVPNDEEELRNTGSFPSGHTARGWAMALVLAEINPERQDDILLRGYEYGESRVIAGFHYQSDVDAARLAASAAVARLHADAAFCKQLDKAKKEFARLKKK